MRRTPNARHAALIGVLSVAMALPAFSQENGAPSLPPPAYRAPAETPAPQTPPEAPAAEPDSPTPVPEAPVKAPTAEPPATPVIPDLSVEPTAAVSGNPDLAALMSGSALPLSIKAKDLTREWRRLSVSGASEMNPSAVILAAAGLGVYYTKSQTLTFAGETYLVAYRIEDNAAILQMMAARQGHEPPGFGDDAGPQPPRKMPREATLALSLLNLRTSGSLNDIRPFDPALDVEQELTAAQVDALSLENLRQLGIALERFRAQHNQTLPNMNDAAAVRRDLVPYPLRNVAVLIHPRTREPYLPNPALSGKKMQHIVRPGEMVAFYEAKPGADGARGVLFLDGSVKRVPEEKWPRIRKSARIPDPQLAPAPPAPPVAQY